MTAMLGQCLRGNIVQFYYRWQPPLWSAVPPLWINFIQMSCERSNFIQISCERSNFIQIYCGHSNFSQIYCECSNFIQISCECNNFIQITCERERSSFIHISWAGMTFDLKDWAKLRFNTIALNWDWKSHNLILSHFNGFYLVSNLMH